MADRDSDEPNRGDYWPPFPYHPYLSMTAFEPGERVRIDLPDETDPDHETFHGRAGEIVEVLVDDAEKTTGDVRDATIYRVEFPDGTTVDFRWRDLRPSFDE